MATPATLIAAAQITAVNTDLTDPADPAYRVSWAYYATDGTTTVSNNFNTNIPQSATLVKNKRAADVINSTIAQAAQTQIQEVSNWQIDLGEILISGLFGVVK